MPSKPPSSFGDAYPDSSAVPPWLTGTTDSNPYSGQVYIGKRSGRSYTGSSADLVNDLPFRWRQTSDPKNKAQLERLFKAVSDATGQPIRSFDDALKIWQLAVKKSASMWQATLGGKKGKPTTPWEELADAARDRQAGIANDISGTAAGGRHTSIARSVDEISEGTAWSVLDNATRNALGRAPTDSELRRFASRAADIAHRNPTITKETTDESGNTTRSSSTSRSGANQNDYELAAMKMANQSPEAASFQVASTYFNALQEAINEPISLESPLL